MDRIIQTGIYAKLSPELKTAIQASHQNGHTIELIDRIFTYLDTLEGSPINGIKRDGEPLSLSSANDNNGSNNPQLKKVKLESSSLILSLCDITFAAPLRKKLNLFFYNHSLIISKSKTAADATSDDNLVLQLDYANDITSVSCLPVPEKAAPQYNILIFGTQNPNEPTAQFSLPESYNEKLIGQNKLSREIMMVGGDQPPPSFNDLIVTVFQSLANIEVDVPRKEIFASAVRGGLNKDIVNLYVGAHRGSKEGVLYFLNDKIIYGFKKPVLLLGLHEIDSVSFSSVTRMTFNLVINLVPELASTLALPPTLEFAMIDQDEYAGIEQYIITHGLDNNSMSQERRAKVQLKENLKHQTLNAEAQTELNNAHSILNQEIEENTQDYHGKENNENEKNEENDDDDDEDDDDYEINSSDDDGGSPGESSDEEEMSDEGKEMEMGDHDEEEQE